MANIGTLTHEKNAAGLLTGKRAEEVGAKLLDRIELLGLSEVAGDAATAQSLAVTYALITGKITSYGK